MPHCRAVSTRLALTDCVLAGCRVSLRAVLRCPRTWARVHMAPTTLVRAVGLGKRADVLGHCRFAEEQIATGSGGDGGGCVGRERAGDERAVEEGARGEGAQGKARGEFSSSLYRLSDLLAFLGLRLTSSSLPRLAHVLVLPLNQREKRRKELLLKERKEAELKKKEEEEVQRRLLEEKIRAEERARLEAEKLLAEAVAEADKENDSPSEDGDANSGEDKDERAHDEPSSPAGTAMETTQIWVTIEEPTSH